MPICNILDMRTRKFRWKTVDAIVEATAQDNRNKDADEAPASNPPEFYTFEELTEISVQEAICWAQQFEFPVTLTLLDGGSINTDDEE